MNSSRRLLETLFNTAVAAARGREAVSRSSTVEGDRWLYGRSGHSVSVRLPQRGGNGKVLILGAGKAAASLASGLEQVLGDRVDDGLVIVKHAHREELQRVKVLEASHPSPDLSSLQATHALLALLDTATRRDTIFFVLSGGASSLLFAPARGLSYEAKATATRLLVNSGAAIEQVNVVRKHLSGVKGGRLRLRARCAEFCTLAISDVIGDDLSAIGSGPTVPDSSTFGDAMAIIERHGLRDTMPSAVLAHLQRGVDGVEEETPKTTSTIGAGSLYQVVASSRVSLDACISAATRLGYPVEVVSRHMDGNTHEAARRFAAVLRQAAGGSRNRGSPTLLVACGETTLAVRGTGKGGRNQEFALVAALELQGAHNVLLLSAGTDGTDGPTDAAGAFADGTTIARARALGLDPEDHLRRHDVYALIDALGDLYRTGPTGTNVMDLVLGIAF